MRNSDVADLIVGQLLYMSDMAVKAGLQGRAKSTRGTFVGISRSGYINVRRDGIKRHQGYDYFSWNLPWDDDPRIEGVVAAVRWPYL